MFWHDRGQRPVLQGLPPSSSRLENRPGWWRGTTVYTGAYNGGTLVSTGLALRAPVTRSHVRTCRVGVNGVAVPHLRGIAGLETTWLHVRIVPNSVCTSPIGGIEHHWI